MIITLTDEAVISKNPEDVFRFLADPANDPLWRAEINRAVVAGPMKAGAQFSEYTRLSARQPNHENALECIEWQENKRVVFQSVDGAPFFLQSIREVQPAPNGNCKAVYTIAFDTAVVRFALGFPLPAFLIRWKAKSDMKKYLSQLKAALGGPQR